MKLGERGERVTLDQAVASIERVHPKRFAAVFEHGSLQVELYSPQGTDPQTPHTRDEVYIIARGSGSFRLGPETTPFGPGDFLFVPAGVEHRFERFSEDFLTWVLFYGPEGGEKPR